MVLHVGLCAALWVAVAGEPVPVAELARVIQLPEAEVSAQTRSRAVRDLAATASPEAAAALLAAVRHNGPAARMAHSALTQSVPSTALAPLLPQCVADTNHAVRQCCLRAAARVGTTKVLPVLAQMLGQRSQAKDHKEILWAVLKIADRTGQPDGVPPLAPLASRRGMAPVVAYGLSAVHEPALAPVVLPLLDHPDGSVRQAACRAAARLKDGRLGNAMLKHAVQDADDQVRRCALQALPQILPAADRAAAARKLAPQWSDARWGRTVLRTLLKLGSPAAGDVLLPGLSAPDYQQRARVASALGELGYAPAAGALVNMVRSDPEDRVRKQALTALARVATTPQEVGAVVDALDEPVLARTARDALREFRRPAASPHLYVLLKHPEMHVRRTTASTLGMLGEPESAVPLMDAMDSDVEDLVRRAAAQALVTTATADSLPRMLKMLRGKTSHERALKKAFIMVDRTQGFAALLPMLEARERLALEIANLLASDPHPVDEPVFQRLAADRDRLWRLTAVSGLEGMVSQSAQQTLCRLTRDEDDPYIRANAANALRRFRSPQTVACLVDALAGADRQRAPSFVETLHRALKDLTGQDMPPDAALWQAFVAGGLSNGSQPDALVAALEHPDPHVRTLAARQLSLAWAKKPPSAPVGQQALAALGSEEDPLVRVAMVDLVARLPGAVSMPVLLERLEQKPPFEERVALARALDSLGDGRGTLSFVEELDSSNAGVRLKAAQALSRVSGEPFRPSVNWWKQWWKTYAERYRRADR